MSDPKDVEQVLEETPPPPSTAHRWSGWPGAWCLDCGQQDEMEICIATHADSVMCIQGHVMCEEHPPNRCKEHVNGPCPTPGQRLADPYTAREE